jgi:hypothetical protein
MRIRSAWWMLAGCALFCAGLVASLGGVRSQGPPLEIEANVREYLRLAVELGQHDVDSLDYSYGPEARAVDTLKQLPPEQTIKNAALQLAEKVKADPSPLDEDKARNAFLLGQLRAIAGRAETLSVAPSTFDEESRISFGVIAPASFNHAEVNAIQAKLEKLLPGEGGLAERYEAFDKKFIIPPARVPAVLTKAIEGCRAKTVAHIPLPEGEGITVEYVSNRPWSAYSWYQGKYRSVIQFNTDFALTVDRALDLACHEAYPGHHVYNSIREARLVRGRNFQEYSVQPTYSPQSLMSESMATLAADIAFPEPERLRFERDVLFPLVGFDPKACERYLRVEALVDRLHQVEPSIARDYLDGKLEFERAGSELERSALMAHPEAALLYLNEYRSYVMTYTYGRDLVAKVLDERSHGDEGLRWDAYGQLMAQESGTLSIPSETPLQ